jgi:hypothetical protein
LWVARICRSRTKVRMMGDFHRYRALTLEDAREHRDALLGEGVGRRRRRPPQLEITICDFKMANSSRVSWNMKSSGKRSRLCWIT